MKKLYLDAILSPASANALAVPGSTRVLNCHLPIEEKARIVNQRKWDGLMVDIEHDMRSVGSVQRTWMDKDGAIWGRIHVRDQRGVDYVESLRTRGRLPEISLTVCYAGDGLPANTVFNPISASSFNDLLSGMGGANIRKYEARAVSLVEFADVPFSVASAITFASADGTGAKLGETYAFNHSTCTIKEMTTPETTKKETAAAEKTAAPPAESTAEDLDVPWLTQRQAASMLHVTRNRINELESRTAALPQAMNVLNNPDIDLNDRQRNRLIGFVKDPTKYAEFAKVQIFLEDFIETEEEAEGKGDETPAAESEPAQKKRKMNEAQSSIKKPMELSKKKEKKEESSSKIKLSPDMANLMKSIGIDENAFDHKNIDMGEFQNTLSSMTGGIKNPNAKK